MYLTHANSIIESIKNNKGIELYVSKSSQKTKEIEDIAKNNNIKIKRLNMQELDKLIGNKDHRGFALKVKSLNDDSRTLESYLDEFKNKENVFILMLDEIEDPQNFGAILRTSDQLSVDLVISTKRRSAKDNETVLRTSSGASQYVNKLPVSNLNNTIKVLKENGFWIYASDINGQDVNKMKIDDQKIVLIMGNEGNGNQKLVKENSDFLVKIPTNGKIDSLNVSVSTGILIFEMKRQLNLL